MANKKELDKPRNNRIYTPLYSDKEILFIADSALNGNIADKLNLILHNMRVINEKLNKMMTGLNKSITKQK